MSVELPDEEVFGRFGWIVGMQSDALADLLYQLSEDDLELLTAIFVDGDSQTEVAQRRGVSCAAISKRYKRIIGFLREKLSHE